MTSPIQKLVPLEPASHKQHQPMNDQPALTRPHLLRDVCRTCRPQHWAKNIFVLAPLLFSQSFSRPAAIVAGAMAFACFCLWSSAIYCLNDVLDAGADRQHPRKRERPVASGRLSVIFVLGLGFALAGAAGFLAVYALPIAFVLFGVAYLANSVAYCVRFKHKVIIDVLSIAIGFVIRLDAGCAAVAVQPTPWLIVCGFSLALLLGFGKRRLEIEALQEAVRYRPALQSYSVDKLNILLGVASSICLMAYMLYTISPQTIELHKTDKLLYTVPFVAYGIFRYVFKVQEGKYDGPVEILLKDSKFMLNGLLWLLSIFAILYLGNHLNLGMP